jgi:hypothetical protein
MSLNIIPTWQVQEYANTIALLLQQRGSKLRNTVTMANYVGKQASPVEQLGAISMQPVTTRFAPMGRVDAATDRRWVFPLDFDLPQLIDTFDKLRIKLDPKSDYTQNALYAAGRQIDDLIIDAFFADAKTGETGGTTTSFPAGQQVAVNFGAAGNTGLTVAKMREAKRILMANEVDLEAETPTMIVKAKQHDNLLAEAQVISTDFNEKPVLVDGRVTRFLGINIIHCERLDADGSSFDRIPVYVKSGMHFGMWNDITTDISQRKDLQGLPWQVYVTLTGGATRIEEKRVVEIKCA